MGEGVLTATAPSFMQITTVLHGLESEALLGGYPTVVRADVVPTGSGEWQITLHVRNEQEGSGPNLIQGSPQDKKGNEAG